jgi:hypothetical protein
MNHIEHSISCSKFATIAVSEKNQTENPVCHHVTSVAESKFILMHSVV